MGEFLAVAAGMILFALFALRPFPLFIIALAGLQTAALLIVRSANRERSLASVCGWTPLPRSMDRWCVAGGITGLLFALVYRWSYGVSLIPVSLTFVVVPAALIGVAEELVFRGYLQARIRTSGLLLAPVLAAAGHTIYKCALFVFPTDEMMFNLPVLAVFTFGAGLVIGFLRQASGNVLPAVCAHALFDILAYGDRAALPWWVWK